MVHQFNSSAVSPLHLHYVIFIKTILQLKKYSISVTKIFPDNYIDIEGTNLMSTFDKNSLNKVTPKSTTPL